jgi:hypothetical protein
MAPPVVSRVFTSFISHADVAWDAVRADADRQAKEDVRTMRVEAKYNVPRKPHAANTRSR